MPYVLFTPVGGTDPIANERDGAILHICRKYKPECVSLYLSGEMAERQQRDDRYGKCIRWLAEETGFSPEILSVEDTQMREVQVYDTFFETFRPLIARLRTRYPGHTMIFNVSSGTPAMKSALYLLAAFLPFKVLPVQVSTPQRAQNPHLEPQRDYDPEMYWEFDLDRYPDTYVDRCAEVKYTNLNAHLQKDNILSYIRAYDYRAALELARRIRPFVSGNAYALLEAANERIRLNWRGVRDSQIRQKLKLDMDGTRMDRAEYLLWLQMKQKRADTADFIRGLTPALYELMKIAVEEKLGIPLSARYCDDRNRLDLERLEADETGREILAIFNETYEFRGKPFLSSPYYAEILEKKAAGRKWQAPLLRLRDIESCVRNFVAHTITQVDEAELLRRQEQFWRETTRDEPLGSAEIMELIREAVRELDADEAAQTNKLAVQWDAYEMMNMKIEQALAEA